MSPVFGRRVAAAERTASATEAVPPVPFVLEPLPSLLVFKEVGVGVLLGPSSDGGSSSDNANIQQNSYLGNDRQKFKFTRNKDGYYYIFTGASGYSKALDIAGKKTTDGTNVVQYSYNGGKNQMFELSQISPGIYAIKTRITDSASCLDVFEWSQEPGSNIVQWNYWGGDCQLWILEAAS